MPRYAAIDVGSNSIRMEAAEVLPGQPARILAAEREVTRLGESVFRTGVVSEDAIRLTCGVLARMAEMYRKLDLAGVRAVATSAIRDASNQQEFVERASRAAGTHVEVISGREEARLIQLGVQSNWPQTGKRAIVLDIGGGSAEIIVSEDGRMSEAFSKPLGAVRLTGIFLKDDPPEQLELRQMRQYIVEKLSACVRRAGTSGWDRAIATSATALAVASAVARVPRSRRESIDRFRISTAEIRKLYQKLAPLNVSERRKVTGIGPRRAEIILPGVAVLLEFLNEFHLPAVYYSRAGVREGVIADLAARNVGRELARLTREQRREVETIGRRYSVSLEHCRKVADIANLLFTALEPLHSLPPYCGKLLEAAAYLLDVGHFVNSASHHKHSYYVVANSDIAGFTERERVLIASLCRYHRKAMPNPAHGAYQSLTPEERRAVLLMIPILRIADNLDRGPDQRIQGVECRLRDGVVTLEVHARGQIDLGQWAAQQAGEAFRQVYNRPVLVTAARN
jgi:exopolyphosphatase / guanosine-5'-triphosphate,3'-diphosphate pyrophosphatase